MTVVAIFSEQHSHGLNQPNNYRHYTLPGKRRKKREAGHPRLQCSSDVWSCLSSICVSIEPCFLVQNMMVTNAINSVIRRRLTSLTHDVGWTAGHKVVSPTLPVCSYCVPTYLDRYSCTIDFFRMQLSEVINNVL